MTDRVALCSITLVVVLLWLACWPFGGQAVNDGFSYAFTVKLLAGTGRFTYNGWSSAMLGPQALWGAAFVKTFGFSHDVLRASMLPISISCAALAYALHRRFAVPPAWSAFATLLLVASPLFTPWSASFMTDVPGLTLTLLLLHAFASLVRAESAGQVAGWAAALAAIGLLGGCVRQTNFVMAGAGLAIAVGPRRRERVALISIGVALAAYVACAAALLGWNARQPFYVPEGRPRLRDMGRGARVMFAMLLDGLLLTLPLGVALLRFTPPGAARRIAAGVATFAAVMAPSLGPIGQAPRVGNTITPTGLLQDTIDAPGERPIVLAPPVRAALGAASVWMLAFVVAFAGASLRHVRRDAVVGAMRGVGGFAVGGFVVIGLLYLCLLLPRASKGIVFDRYLLVVVPIASVALLYALRDRLAAARPGVAGWSLLVIYALFGAAITFDHFAEMRQRDGIAAELGRNGIPRTAIANGLNYDSWTQLESTGHLNDERVTNPADGYRPDPRAAEREAMFWFLPRTPDVQPQLIVANLPTPPVETAGRRIYPWRAILPPRQRWIEVRDVPIDATPQVGD